MGMYEKIRKEIKTMENHDAIVLSKGRNLYNPAEYGIRDLLSLDNNKITYYLWGTPIVIYDKSQGIITLNTGGWKTKLTRERMNTFLSAIHSGYCIHGSYETRRNPAGEWSIVDMKGNTIPFYDGIELTLKEGSIK